MRSDKTSSGPEIQAGAAPVAPLAKASPGTTPSSTNVGSASDTTSEPLNAAIKYPVTVGEKVTFPSVIAVRDIAYVMNCIKTGIVESQDIRGLIYTLRHVPNSDLVRAMKKELPYFLGSVCKRYRSNATVQFAHFAIFDLDHVRNIEAVKRKATTCPELPYIRYAWRSVRDGVKLIAQFDRPLRYEDDYRELWYYLAYQVEQALGQKVDSTPDWARACYYSHDPKLLVRSHFQPVEFKVASIAAQWHAMSVKVTEQEIRDEMARAEEKGSGTAAGNAGLQPGNAGHQPGNVDLQPGNADHQPGNADHQPGNADLPVGDNITPTRTSVVPWSGNAGHQPGNVDLPVGDNIIPTRTSVIPWSGNAGLQPGNAGLQPGNAGLPVGAVTKPTRTSVVPCGDDYSRAKAIITQLAQMVIPYSDWIKCGHALYSGFGESGRELWNIFQTNPHYHDTARELDQHWRSFARVHSVTLASLFFLGGKYGCV